MDELWQRYRTFWTPLLIGLGVFLVGLIAVHIMTDDPDSLQTGVLSEAGKLNRKIEPTKRQLKNVPANTSVLGARVTDWAARFEGGEVDELLAEAVGSALDAAILRGVDPAALSAAISEPDADASAEILARFDDDAVTAGRALARFHAIRQDRLGLLQSGDPNVGFARLLSDVGSELRIRANRADVDLRADLLGFGGLISVTRAGLLQRLLNLALVAEVVDLGIRSGLRSVDEIRFDKRTATDVGEAFLHQWPVTLTVRGDMASLEPILAYLTDPTRAVPLTQALLTQPPRGSPLEGIVQLTVSAVSVVVRPEVGLELDQEEQRQ
ncbi:MAG: hypothetical protein ACC662_00965 [Planctomycetota bacterium]